MIPDRVPNRIPNRIMDATPVSGGVGVEIRGVDLRTKLSEQGRAEIREALNTYGVVFFRDQNLTPEEHLGFAESFGTIHASQFMQHVPHHPAIAEVRKEPDQKENVGGYWHTDQSYYEAPALGSILVAREVPVWGGDTLFANMMIAYETLSEGLKRTLRGLRAVHCNRGLVVAPKRSEMVERQGGAAGAYREVVHPVVIRHPDSGRNTLYVNPFYTVRFDGWTEAESAPLLNYLYDHAVQPEHTCRFHWKEGSIAFWDNRATWHYAINDYHGDRRLMHRVTIKGVALTAAEQ